MVERRRRSEGGEETKAWSSQRRAVEEAARQLRTGVYGCGAEDAATCGRKSYRRDSDKNESRYVDDVVGHQ